MAFIHIRYFNYLIHNKKGSNYCYSLSRCVRDSNPWPHAWQACILTNWTNAPLFHSLFAISLDCGCKGRHFFDICNSCDKVFFERFGLHRLYILILRSLWKWKNMEFNNYLEIDLCTILSLIWALCLEKTKLFEASFKLTARKLRCFAINRYFCGLKMRMLLFENDK